MAVNTCAATARLCRCMQGAFAIVQRDVVLEDIRQQVAAGAEHMTFGDPDFSTVSVMPSRWCRPCTRNFPTSPMM